MSSTFNDRAVRARLLKIINFNGSHWAHSGPTTRSCRWVHRYLVHLTCRESTVFQDLRIRVVLVLSALRVNVTVEARLAAGFRVFDTSQALFTFPAGKYNL